MRPVRTVSLMRTPRRCRPKRRIKAPAMGASRERFWRRKVPTALAEAPKEIKTTEKPTTKESEEAKRPARRGRLLRVRHRSFAIGPYVHESFDRHPRHIHRYVSPAFADSRSA